MDEFSSSLAALGFFLQMMLEELFWPFSMVLNLLIGLFLRPTV